MKAPFVPGGKRPVPEHPYRDTIIIYGSLSLIVLVLAAVTGHYWGILFVAIAFVGSTVYSFWYWRDRLREQDEEEEEGQ
jgi:hypothetical protein